MPRPEGSPYTSTYTYVPPLGQGVVWFPSLRLVLGCGFKSLEFSDFGETTSTRSLPRVSGQHVCLSVRESCGGWKAKSQTEV